MAFSVDGLVSGLDTKTIIADLMKIEQAPLTTIESREATASSELTTWRSFSAQLLAFETAAGRLTDASLYQSRKATSGNTDRFEVAASAGTAVGSFTLSVEALATNHQLISQGFATEDASVGTGTITLQVGPAIFAPITIAAGDGTLEGIRDAINEANLGVAASIVDRGADAGASRYNLVLSSNTSGTDGAITATFDLSGGTLPVFSDLTAAQNAHVKLGSGAGAVDVYSSTNTVTSILPGVTIKLKSAAPGVGTELKLESDTEAIRKALEGFAKSYNDLNTFFSEQFDYDPETGKSGTLFGDSNLQRVQSRLVDLVTNPTGSGALRSLSQLGYNLGPGGRLSLTDDKALQDALKDPTSVKNLLSAEDTGIAVKVRDELRALSDARTGVVAIQEERLTARLEDLRISKLRTLQRLDRVEADLRKRFVDMERTLSLLQSQTRQLSGLVAQSAGGMLGGVQ